MPPLANQTEGSGKLKKQVTWWGKPTPAGFKKAPYGKRSVRVDSQYHLDRMKFNLANRSENLKAPNRHKPGPKPKPAGTQVPRARTFQGKPYPAGFRKAPYATVSIRVDSQSRFSANKYGKSGPQAAPKRPASKKPPAPKSGPKAPPRKGKGKAKRAAHESQHDGASKPAKSSADLERALQMEREAHMATMLNLQAALATGGKEREAHVATQVSLLAALNKNDDMQAALNKSDQQLATMHMELDKNGQEISQMWHLQDTLVSRLRQEMDSHASLQDKVHEKIEKKKKKKDKERVKDREKERERETDSSVSSPASLHEPELGAADSPPTAAGPEPGSSITRLEAPTGDAHFISPTFPQIVLPAAPAMEVEAGAMCSTGDCAGGPGDWAPAAAAPEGAAPDSLHIAEPESPPCHESPPLTVLPIVSGSETPRLVELLERRRSMAPPAPPVHINVDDPSTADLRAARPLSPTFPNILLPYGAPAARGAARDAGAANADGPPAVSSCAYPDGAGPPAHRSPPLTVASVNSVHSSISILKPASVIGSSAPTTSAPPLTSKGLPPGLQYPPGNPWHLPSAQPPNTGRFPPNAAMYSMLSETARTWPALSVDADGVDTPLAADPSRLWQRYGSPARASDADDASSLGPSISARPLPAWPAPSAGPPSHASGAGPVRQTVGVARQATDAGSPWYPMVNMPPNTARFAPPVSWPYPVVDVDSARTWPGLPQPPSVGPYLPPSGLQPSAPPPARSTSPTLCPPPPSSARFSSSGPQPLWPSWPAAAPMPSSTTTTRSSLQAVPTYPTISAAPVQRFSSPPPIRPTSASPPSVRSASPVMDPVSVLQSAMPGEGVAAPTYPTINIGKSPTYPNIDVAYPTVGVAPKYPTSGTSGLGRYSSPPMRVFTSSPSASVRSTSPTTSLMQGAQQGDSVPAPSYPTINIGKMPTYPTVDVARTYLQSAMPGEGVAAPTYPTINIGKSPTYPNIDVAYPTVGVAPKYPTSGTSGLGRYSSPPMRVFTSSPSASVRSTSPTTSLMQGAQQGDSVPAPSYPTINIGKMPTYPTVDVARTYPTVVPKYPTITALPPKRYSSPPMRSTSPVKSSASVMPGALQAGSAPTYPSVNIGKVPAFPALSYPTVGMDPASPTFSTSPARRLSFFPSPASTRPASPNKESVSLTPGMLQVLA